jgi:hypothetical protein
MPKIHADKVVKTSCVATHALSVLVGGWGSDIMVVLAMGSQVEMEDFMNQVIRGELFRDMLTKRRKFLTINFIGDDGLPTPGGAIAVYNLEKQQWYRDAFCLNPE